MKKKLLIVTKNVFTQNDYQRFKIDKIKKNFKIFYLDCSFLFYGKNKNKDLKLRNYLKIKNIYEFISIINNLKPDLIFDQLGFTFTYKTIFLRLFANLKTKCLFFFTGPKLRIPSVTNLKTGINFLFLAPLKFLGLLKNYLTKKIFIKFNFFNSIILLTSSYREDMIKNMLSRKIIYFHSNDYDNCLRNSKIPKILNKKYAVFIDENVPDHDDYKISNFKSPIKAEIYYDLLNNFFDKFEKKFNIKVVIALHPKSKISKMKNNFLSRKIYVGKTRELIFNSKIVFTHCSTSRSYAILNYKPLVYLTSDIIEKTWFGREIYLNCKLTGSKLVNLDKVNFNFLKSSKVNFKKYKLYKNNFLKHPKSKNILFENIFEQIFLKN